MCKCAFKTDLNFCIRYKLVASSQQPKEKDQAIQLYEGSWLPRFAVETKYRRTSMALHGQALFTVCSVSTRCGVGGVVRLCVIRM